jgi:hypothetical protein
LYADRAPPAAIGHAVVKSKNEMASVYPTRADIFGGLFVVVLLCVCGVAAIIGPQQRTNAGFGQEWDCKVIPKSEPICIKIPSH